MENGELSMEEIRREKRRQKILSNSSDRIKKIITGYSDCPNKDDGSPSILPEVVPQVRENLLADNIRQVIQEPSLYEHSHDEEVSDLLDSTEPVPDLFDSEQHLSDEQPVPKRKTPVVNDKSNTFTTIRTLLVLASGILVRLSFLSSLGEQYVQTVFNPFMAMEIAIIGYQKAVNMDFGADVKGGIWLSTLVLAGMKPEIITAYKNVMGILSAIGLDFTLYLFGLIITHVIINGESNNV